MEGRSVEPSQGTHYFHNVTARRRVTAVDVSDPLQPVEAASLEVWTRGGCAAVAPLNEHSCFLYDCSVSTDTDECCCVPRGC